ncbi:MAG: 23S rRNA (adenine(2503)-C(2))-methyltransferase RlmN [Deltaproteobacteria bacterium]|nr:23S rRNA (adenine(2503)-C(2))-methyltransferase RlmN [Myxococcales bacterium]MDP3220160.1 23S rRNA (adenine(2503)-C(2))-methyltransferase RlmN [Deltaproteobacteria bacterium]
MPPASHDIQRDPVGSYLEEWEALLAGWGERPFRAKQVFRWIHTRSVADPAGMTDIAKTLREKLTGATLHMPVVIERLHRAADDTRKVLVGFPDTPGSGTVETVLIPPMPDDDADDELDDEPNPAMPRIAARRVTQCISTQVGCAMGCVFCASGVAGLKRHLTAGEIVGQVLLGRTLLDEGEAIRNVVLMGMGEPLHNYDAVARALRLLTHRDGLDLSTRRVTVSTSGLVPEIDRLGEDFRGEVALAISLHAPTDELRSSLMPINRRYPLAELMPALRRYPLARRRRITVEYTLIRGVNDQAAHARALSKLLRGLSVKVNLIPLNPVEGVPYAAPVRDDVLSFQTRLRDDGYSVFIRKTRGDDIDAACGQLALQGAKPVKRTLPVFGGARDT